MSLFPFMDNILSVLDSPEAATMGSTFGIRDELVQMRMALGDVIRLKLEPIKGALGGADYLQDLIGLGMAGFWWPFRAAVFDAECLLDELSMELALRRGFGGVEDTLSRKIGRFFSGRNPLAYSRRLTSRIRQINRHLSSFSNKPLDFDGGAWKQQASSAAVLQGLEWSFYNLPLRLKHCFLCCLLFPENYAIDKSTLIQLWMALGLVPSAHTDNSCMEEAGSAYITDLCRRSLLSMNQEDVFGNILSFKVHNLVYSFAKSISHEYSSSLFREEIFFHVSSTEFRYYRRWSIYSDELNGPRSTARLNWYETQTFLVPYQPRLVNRIPDHESDYEKLMQMSARLRVLDMHHMRIKNVPISLDKLKHLRYLDLSENPCIEMLPCSITRLWNLQTLKLSHCERLKELPEDIAKLVNLRHLEIEGCYRLDHMPCGIGQLKYLNTLSMFVMSRRSDDSASPKKAGLSELEGLDHLRGGLELRGLHNVKDAMIEVKAANVKEKKNLQSLTLVWETRGAIGGDDDDTQTSRDDEMTLDCLEPNLYLKGLCIYAYAGAKFPTWSSRPLHLVKITLSDCRRCQYIPPLDQLFVLQHLTLEKLNALDYIIGNDPESPFRRPRVAAYFPSLEQLCLRELPNLKGWFEEDIIKDWEDGMYREEPLPTSFSVLSMVTIDDCPELSMLLAPSVWSLHVNKTGKNQLQSLLQPSLPWLSLPHSEKEMVSSSNIPDANLKSLRVSYMRELDRLPETYFSELPLLEDLEIRHCPSLMGVPPLKSLKYLTIFGCQKLASLSGWIGHLTALENLKLQSCPALDLSLYHSHSKIEQTDLRWWPEFEMSESLDSREPKLDSCSASDGSGLWGNLQRLTSLEIVEMTKLVLLPDGLRLATSLERLELTACDALEEFPEWISELRHLHKLVLNFCPKLRFLPKGLGDLKELSELKIIGCPLLTSRYNGTGADIARLGYSEVHSFIQVLCSETAS